MPNKHKYMMIIGKDDCLIQDIMFLFHDCFTPFVEDTINQSLIDIREYKEQLAVVLIDDSIGVEGVIYMLDICHQEHLDIQIPMFLLDGYHDDYLYNEAVSLGIDEVIRKPYRRDILKRRVLNLTDLFRHKYRLEWLVNTQTKELKESIRVLNDMRIDVLESLGTITEFRSFESGEHIYRVRFVTELLMKEFQKCYPEYGITNEMISEICLAAIVHDIGKIAVSDLILKKPGKLTDAEFELMKKHTEYGCDIIKQFKGLYNDDTFHFYYDVIRYHHEKWDGNGYPDGLKGNEIPIWAQIVSLADIYDALTNERIYKPPYDHDKAVAMIFNGECGLINPQVLECFLHIENNIKQTSTQHLDKQKIYQTNYQNDDHNLVLHSFEKERAIHRAYTELLPSYYFEYDSDYHTVQHYNILGRTNLEQYTTDMFQHIHPHDRDAFAIAIKNATTDYPTIKVKAQIQIDIHKEKYTLCFITIRTIWDIYTGLSIGGVGKIDILDPSEN